MNSIFPSLDISIKPTQYIQPVIKPLLLKNLGDTKNLTGLYMASLILFSYIST